MKKKIAMLLAAASLLTLTACDKKEEAEETLMIPVLTEAVETQAVLTEAPTFPETTEVTITSIPEETPAPETEAATEAVTEAVTEAPTEAVTEAATVPAETEAAYELPKDFTQVDEMVSATRNVNIRTEPAVQSDSPGKLPKGDSVRRVGTNQAGWSAVIYNDQLCYIASEYLTVQEVANPGGGTSVSSKDVTETAATGTVVANHTVNFRKTPHVSGKWLASIPQGTELELLAECSNGWVKVKYKDMEGYVAGGYVDKA